MKWACLLEHAPEWLSLWSLLSSDTDFNTSIYAFRSRRFPQAQGKLLSLPKILFSGRTMNWARGFVRSRHVLDREAYEGASWADDGNRFPKSVCKIHPGIRHKGCQEQMKISGCLKWLTEKQASAQDLLLRLERCWVWSENLYFVVYKTSVLPFQAAKLPHQSGKLCLSDLSLSVLCFWHSTQSRGAPLRLYTPSLVPLKTVIFRKVLFTLTYNG